MSNTNYSQLSLPPQQPPPHTVYLFLYKVICIVYRARGLEILVQFVDCRRSNYIWEFGEGHEVIPMP